MKFTIAILLLGALLGSVATCDITSCSLTGTLTGTVGCTTYQTYIDCLTTLTGTCTSSIVDVSNKIAIGGAITTNKALRLALGCSGANITSISSIALILSVVVTLVKTHF